MSWTAKIHWADEEYGTSAYNETALTNVTALAGYDTYSLEITAVDASVEGASPVQYANGALQSARLGRWTYSLKSAPVSFATGRYMASTNLMVLRQKPYLWVELNTYSQDSGSNVGNTSTAYHTADYVIPVTIDTISVEHDHEHGQKFYTIELKHRFFQS